MTAPRIVLWIVLVIAVVTAGVGVVGLFAIDASASEPAGLGRIGGCSRAGVDFETGNTRWSCTVTYEFRERTFSAPLRRESSSLPTGTLRVFVDPDDPANATFGFSGASKLTFMRWMIAVSAAVVAVCGAVLVGLKLRSR